MMRKRLATYTATLLLIFLNCSIVLGQELVVAQPLDMGRANTIKDAIPVISDTQEPTLILFDKYAVHLVEFDSAFQEKNRSRFNLSDAFYDHILGYSFDSKGFHLFFSNKKKNQFHLHSINLNEQTIQRKLIPIRIKKEKYLASLNDKGLFYIFTIVKNSSVIKLYGLEGGELALEKEFDFSGFKFSSSITFPELYSAITTSEQLKQVVDLPKVDPNNPVSVEQASKKSKLYFVDGKVYITLDNNLQQTNLITIDLNNFSSDVRQYQQPLPRCSDNLIKTNSFLSNGRLFQVQVCRSGISVQSTDIETKEKYAQLSTSVEEGLPFKNGPAIQEGSTWVYTQGIEKELVRPRQVLRKLINSEIGLSAYQHGDNVVLTIGGHKEVRQNSGIGGFTTTPGTTIQGPGGPVTLPGTTTYNPTLYGYRQYRNSRSVYFKSLLEQQSHDHLKGNISQNAFDKMRSFEESSNQFSKKIKNETIFRIGDTYFFGYYNTKEDVYAIHSFQDDSL